MNVEHQIEGFEGRRCVAYPDPLTGGAPWTIGVGHCGSDVHEGTEWTDEQVDMAFARDIDRATHACRFRLPWFDGLNEPRQAVLIGMVFQLGTDGMLGFKLALDAIRDERWPDAAEHLRQSKWSRQTPKRVAILARQLETGEWQA